MRRAWVTLLVAVSPLQAQTSIPAEPVKIGMTPQLMLDSYIVDNTWAIRYKMQHVNRVFHVPQKHSAEPILKVQGGYICVARDDKGFHMWYQAHVLGKEKVKGKDKFEVAIAYVSSPDGLKWTLPKLGLHPWEGTKESNIVIPGKRSASGPWLLDVPEKDRRGYKYILSYHDADGLHLAGTHDGIHFHAKDDLPIQHLHSDTQNAIVYDPHQDQYVMYCRARNIYRAFGEEMLDTGESRRIARVTSKTLWTDWSRDARQILLPDELDTKNRYHAFYGMPTTVYGGVFFGFLWPFRWNDKIHTELAWSRDGTHFERHPLRPRLVDYGPDGSWEDEMVFASHWLPVGDEWWIYYAGADGPHNSRERKSAVGLAKVRKEGFVSLQGPPGGGVVCTRVLDWPGDRLFVNAAVTAKAGKLTVRVSGPDRKVIPGFDHTDCNVFQGDSTGAEITWNAHSISELKGTPLRLEIYIQDCDLYSFRAAMKEP